MQLSFAGRACSMRRLADDYTRHKRKFPWTFASQWLTSLSGRACPRVGDNVVGESAFRSQKRPLVSLLRTFLSRLRRLYLRLHLIHNDWHHFCKESCRAYIGRTNESRRRSVNDESTLRIIAWTLKCWRDSCPVKHAGAGTVPTKRSREIIGGFNFFIFFL